MIGGRFGRVRGIAVAGVTPGGIDGRGPDGAGVGVVPMARIGGRDDTGPAGGGDRRGMVRV